MSKNGKILIPILVLVGSVVGTVAIINNMPEKPLMFRFVEEKLKSIITPKPPIGDLTPVRDLKGTWKSSLSGKGLQVYGKFVKGPVTITVYADGDIELIIDSMKNNTASGKIRYTNFCVYVETTAPDIGTIVTPKQCTKDLGYTPIAIRVSGSHLDFGTVTTNGAIATMQGSYTTDIITGTMTVTTSYGVLKGEFHLSRTK